MSGEPADFLSRWSRRKREAERSEARGPSPGVGPEADALPEPADPPVELSPEELAALPPIEELTAQTDITVFLRRGVPEALKNAALRRMWILDPAIRDHVGDARDYAYDWNVPGGVPGNGPMLATDDVGEMVKRVFGDAPESGPAEPAEVRESTVADSAATRGEHDSATVQDASAVQQDEGAYDDPDSLATRPSASETLSSLPLDPGPKDGAVPLGQPMPSRRRRHGGAIPV
jgi:hypothetical protein